MGKQCANFVVFTLANGYVAHICFPAPAKDWTNSKVIHSGENPYTRKKNAKTLNEMFGKKDNVLADCGFRTFTSTGSHAHLLKMKVVTKLTKPYKTSIPPISLAIAENLCDDRKKIEQNFGWHKYRFACLQKVPSGQEIKTAIEYQQLNMHVPLPEDSEDPFMQVDSSSSQVLHDRGDLQPKESQEQLFRKISQGKLLMPPHSRKIANYSDLFTLSNKLIPF